VPGAAISRVARWRPLTGPERQQLAATLGKLYATTAEARPEFAG
jgi:hypothetical protein